MVINDHVATVETAIEKVIQSGDATALLDVEVIRSAGWLNENDPPSWANCAKRIRTKLKMFFPENSYLHKYCAAVIENDPMFTKDVHGRCKPEWFLQEFDRRFKALDVGGFFDTETGMFLKTAPAAISLIDPTKAYVFKSLVESRIACGTTKTFKAASEEFSTDDGVLLWNLGDQVLEISRVRPIERLTLLESYQRHGVLWSTAKIRKVDFSRPDATSRRHRWQNMSPAARGALALKLNGNVLSPFTIALAAFLSTMLLPLEYSATKWLEHIDGAAIPSEITDRLGRTFQVGEPEWPTTAPAFSLRVGAVSGELAMHFGILFSAKRTSKDHRLLRFSLS